MPGEDDHLLYCGNFAWWAGHMARAGWSFWLWNEYPNSDIMWRHDDEYEATITIQESLKYYRKLEVPDPYDILASISQEKS